MKMVSLAPSGIFSEQLVLDWAAALLMAAVIH